MAREYVLLQRVLNSIASPSMPSHDGLAQRQVHLHAGRTIIIVSSPAQQRAGALRPDRSLQVRTRVDHLPDQSLSCLSAMAACAKRVPLDGFRFVGRLFTRQHDWRQFCFRFFGHTQTRSASATKHSWQVWARDGRDAVPAIHIPARWRALSLVKLRRWVRPSRAESAAVASVKSRSTTDSLAALLALVLICSGALG